NVSFSVTTLARTLNHSAHALACGASARDAEEALLESDLSAARTLFALRSRFAGSCARASALLAGFATTILQRALSPESCFLERQSYILAQVRATLHARTAATTATLLAEHVSEAEHLAENFAEVHGLESSGTGAASVDCGVSKAVVGRALISIAQDRIGFAALLELIFSRRIIGVAVGMKLEREFAVCALDLNIG